MSGCSHYRLYKERMGQVDHKLEEVRAGRAAEYLNPLSQLQENMRIRTEVAGETRNLFFSPRPLYDIVINFFHIYFFIW